jgi:Domain of unknown function (DUF4287)/Domain of unknown function (DUF5655)
MSFQAYLDNIQAKTGKTADDFRALARKDGLAKSGEIVAWLKAEFKLGHGHASAIAHLLVHSDEGKKSPDDDDKVRSLFAGNKAKWRDAYDALTTKVAKFGADVQISPNRTYINLQRSGKKFAILQPSAAERLDVGLKLKGVAPSGPFEAAGSWNAMVTHRVRISDARQINAELFAWLKLAYDAAL